VDHSFKVDHNSKADHSSKVDPNFHSKGDHSSSSKGQTQPSFSKALHSKDHLNSNLANPHSKASGLQINSSSDLSKDNRRSSANFLPKTDRHLRATEISKDKFLPKASHSSNRHQISNLQTKQTLRKDSNLCSLAGHQKFNNPSRASLRQINSLDLNRFKAVHPINNSKAKAHQSNLILNSKGSGHNSNSILTLMASNHLLLHRLMGRSNQTRNSSNSLPHLITKDHRNCNTFHLNKGLIQINPHHRISSSIRVDSPSTSINDDRGHLNSRLNSPKICLRICNQPGHLKSNHPKHHHLCLLNINSYLQALIWAACFLARFDSQTTKGHRNSHHRSQSEHRSSLAAIVGRIRQDRMP
jgi:hypothetical protein